VTFTVNSNQNDSMSLAARLPDPHGGSLVHLFDSIQSFKNESLPIIEIDSWLESEFIKIANGSYSPLTGFMSQEEIKSVCAKAKLLNGLTWTIPVFLDLTAEDAQHIRGQTVVGIRSKKSGKLLGIVEASEIFDNPKNEIKRGLYGTESLDHAGVALIESRGPFLLSGKVTAFRESIQEDALSTPAGVRAELSRLKLWRTAAFHTRNVVHRAHEYLQRVALEVADGLLVQPVVGWKKSGDFKSEVVEASYRSFVEAIYPKDRVVLSLLDLNARYGGPKEAIFHAIVRKNFGCTYLVVGRDHAGVKDFYPQYGSQDIFDQFPDLGISPLKLKEPFYCTHCLGIATVKTCGHSERERTYISGTLIRDLLRGEKTPPPEIFRPEVFASLQDFKKAGFFYE
jgi:sulfate adenylyltransferase